jgi:hypothetical protein
MARTVAELEAEIARLQAEFNAVQAAARASGDINSPLLNTREELRAQIAQLRRELRTEAAQENSIQPEPPTTASQAASDDAPRGPNAPAAAQVSASGRIVAPPDTTAPTNADAAPTSENNPDAGLNAKTRTTQQTQATSSQGSNPPGTGFGSGSPEDLALYPTTAPGASSAPDDGVTPSATTTQTNTNAASNALKIQPRPNPLDQFASYTYSISVYLLSATQYERLLRSKTKKIDGYFLLFQDGGAPVNRGGEKQGMGTADISASDSGRNPFFPYDYYIDSLTLDTSPLGKATGASHMTASMKLVVNEPNGITLIDNLYSAVANLQQNDGSGKVNYTAADYLAVIRFYGQGADGNPVQVRASGGAAIEKFIPFKLAAINWSIGSKMVTYEWDCVPQGQLIAGYTARGSIPHDMQITSTTVGKLLGSDLAYSGTDAGTTDPGKMTTAQLLARDAAGNDARGTTAPAPPKTDAAPTTKKTVTQGLMGALTKFQEELTVPQKGQSEPIFTIADRYFIKFVDGISYDGKVIPASAIENAKISVPGTKIDKHLVGSGKNDAVPDPQKQSQDNMSRSFSITAGQMITQAIELAIRNSTYILDQALVVENSDGYQIPNPDKRNSPMTWFNIIMNAVPRSGGIDPKRNDHAFDITYTIKPYRLQNFNSKYFPPSRFAGVHKSYPYWFTGRNTAVVEYQETMNALYSITVSGSDPKNSAAAKIREAATSSLRDIAKYNYAVTSGQSTQGSADTRLNETAANAADYLFSPGDLANAKIKILGDPDWIQQGSLFKEIKVGESQVADITGFGEDGSISFETGDVLFEVVWQRPEDYDLNTGLADPYGGGYSGRANKAREPIQSRVYQAVKIISEFRQGAFYQTVEGTLYQFPLPNKQNTVNAGAGAATSDALDQGRKTGTQGKLTQAQLAAAQRAPGSGSSITSRLGNQTDANQTDAETARLNRQNAASAGVLGAQQASGKQPNTRLSSSNAGVNADTLPQNAGINIRPAGPPGAATDGTGNPVTVEANINAGPPKLPGVGAGQNTLTDTQIAQLEEGIPAGGDNPTSSTNPSNQDIATDGG